MTEPGISLLGKTSRSLLPFLTSGLMWSAGMKSFTGRSPGFGVWCVGGDPGTALGTPAGVKVHCACLGLHATRGRRLL